MQAVQDYMDESRQGEALSAAPASQNLPAAKKFYIESYGCQMNFNDSEIVASILQSSGFGSTRNFEDADLVLINTCSIREKAEQTVRNRLNEFRKVKRQKPDMMVGVLGCMAERLKTKFLEEEKLVDLVVGPDAYRSLPDLVVDASEGQKSVNVLLSREETYADISPLRLDSNGVSAFVSIMRGCNNMCSFCVVPFTRGRERSRDPRSILQECLDLLERGYREVTLLGQNVDSYYWVSDSGEEVTFAGLLGQVALLDPQLRVRFSTSHPKDITDEVLHTMTRHANICNYIHLPVQSGSNRILQLMNRTYTREWYLARVRKIRELLPDCGLSSDIITGFCTETEEDHAQTLDLMREAGFDLAYMFAYSERPGTLAARRYQDDISEGTKKRRLSEIVDLQRSLALLSMQRDLDKSFQVLVEGDSKRNSQYWCGRNDQNKMVVFPKDRAGVAPGSYVQVSIEDCTAATLIGRMI